MKSESNVDVNRLAKIMLKFVRNTSAVGVQILLAVSDSARQS